MEFIKRARASIRSLRFFSIWASLFLCSVLHAQDRCDVEVKLLLSPSEDQVAFTALDVKKETTGFVYFFDTNTLDLLSQGVIVRLRQGIGNATVVQQLLGESGLKACSLSIILVLVLAITADTF
jgi:hypothetical protein